LTLLIVAVSCHRTLFETLLRRSLLILMFRNETLRESCGQRGQNLIDEQREHY
jgi:hypothetical protein